MDNLQLIGNVAEVLNVLVSGSIGARSMRSGSTDRRHFFDDDDGQRWCRDLSSSNLMFFSGLFE